MEDSNTQQAAPNLYEGKPLFRFIVSNIASVILVILIFICVGIILYLRKQELLLKNEMLLIAEKQTQLQQDSLDNNQILPVTSPGSEQGRVDDTGDELHQVTCQNAFQGDNRGQTVTVSQATAPGMCELRYEGKWYNYKLNFPEGYLVRFSGADVSAAIGINKKDNPTSYIIINPETLAENSSLDLSKPEEVLVMGWADDVSIVSGEQVLSSVWERVGTKEVVILTTTSLNKPVNSNPYYTRSYYLIDKPSRVIYAFTIHSRNKEFNDPYDEERTSLIEDLIDSMSF